MKRILKNQLRGNIDQWFRGRKVSFRSKASRVFDMDDEEEAAEYKFWREMCGFIDDITSKVVVKND